MSQDVSNFFYETKPLMNLNWFLRIAQRISKNLLKIKLYNL